VSFGEERILSGNPWVVTPAKEEQCRVMDELVDPCSEHLTPLERFITTVFGKWHGSYLGSVLLCVLTLYGANYALFFWFSERVYEKEVISWLFSLLFNPIFLVTDALTVLFCVWFVRYQSHAYVHALRDIRHLTDSPEQERPHSRSGMGILIRVLYDPLNRLSRRSRRLSTLLVASILVFMPPYLIWRFPVYEGYHHILLYLAMFILGSWLIVPVTWDPPEKYKGINKNLWSAFRSHQASLATIFTLSIAFSELTWVTSIPTMWSRGFFKYVYSLSTVILHLEVWLGYLFLFAFLASFAHVICSVAVGVFFLWDRGYIVSLDPLDEFGSGGLRPLGVLVEHSTFAIAAILAMMFVSRFVVYPIGELRDPYYLQLALGATVLIIFSFVFPVVLLHWKIKELKLTWVRNCRSRKISVLQEKAAGLNSVELLGSSLAEGYSRIRNINDWPVSPSAWVRVLLSSLAPIASYLVSLYLRGPL